MNCTLQMGKCILAILKDLQCHTVNTWQTSVRSQADV